ncbi:MAG: hypothetical protein AB1736_15135, partial [Chloroflexota bacterium]
RPPPWPAALTLLAFASLGAVTGRGIAWWPLVAAVTVAGFIAPVAAGPQPRPRPRPRGSVLNAGLAAALVVGIAAALPAWRPLDARTGAPAGLLTYAPPGITAVLRATAGPQDRVWNPQAWGSWLELAVPGPRYAFDSRIELIPAEAWAAGDTVLAAAPGWDAILEAYGATIVVVEGPPTGPLAAALAASGGWTLATRDEDGSIWVARHRQVPMFTRLSSPS